MRGLKVFLALIVALSAAAAPAQARKKNVQTQEEEELFESATKLFRAQRDKIAAITAFESFLRRYDSSPRAADAQFMIGEAYMNQALKILHKEAEEKKTNPTRLLSPKNAAAVSALKRARAAYESVIGNYRKTTTGLLASAQYRLGETAYNEKDWGAAIEEWRKVEEEHPKSYLVPESWMGIIFANLALEQFSQAEANLFLLGETYPHYLKVPEVLYVQGIVSLHKGDYANAERALKEVKTAEAQFYLGKTYLLSKRSYLAAAAFRQLVKQYPDSVLVEETEFFIGDSFFLAKDFNGAITNYKRFQAKYPDSMLRVSALFRIGSAYFQMKNYIEARAHFQAVIDRYPRDFFAPLAQYTIAESYLVEEQFREALFAYTKVITQYPETIKISPLAHYKLAWSQFNVGDYVQAAQTCRNFLSLYPTHSLAKNVYIVLANSLLRQKRYDQAVTSFQRIIDLAPTSDIAEQALFSILQTQHGLQNCTSVLTSYQFIFRHLPPSQSKWRPLSYIYAAECYLSLKRIDEARAIYQMVKKVYPNDVSAIYAQDGLAWTYSFEGDDDQALAERQELQKMIKVARSSFTFTGTNTIGIANSMYNQKQYEDAFHLYKQFFEGNPKDERAAKAMYNAGMSLYHQQYYTEAIDLWSRLATEHPDSEEATKSEYQIADTRYRAQEYERAIRAYNHIIKKYPQATQAPLAHLRVTLSHYNLKQDPEALNAALLLLKQFPESAEATDALDLMEAIYDRNPTANFKKSLDEVVASVAGSNTGGDAQFRIGRRYFEKGQFLEAAAAFQKFSVDYTGNKKLKKAQFLLGESYFNAGKHEDAVYAFGRFLENFPRNPDTALALFHLASAHYSQKNYEPAIKSYMQLLDEYPASEYGNAAQFNLALAFKATGKLDRSAQAYERYAIMAGPCEGTGKDALWELFAIQKDLHNFNGARETVERLENCQNAMPAEILEATYRKGELLVAMKQFDEAVAVWEGLLDMKPKNNPFRLQGLIKLGEMYEERKSYALAVEVYTDLGHNADAQVAPAARERAKGLQQMLKGGEGGKPRGRAPREEAPPQRKTQVMPSDQKSKDPKSQQKPKRRNKKTDTNKEINIPGMN
ncbi:MAG: tetratricopeptide repeat protein [Elusimicrobiota bacterium]